MSDQASNTNQTATTESAPAAAPANEAPAQAAASFDPAEITRMQKEIADLRKEAADRRVKAKESEDARQREEAAKLDALKKAGEFEPVLAKYEARIKELEARTPLADRYEAQAARKREEIEAELPSLPDWVRPAIAAALKHGEVDDAHDALAKFKASQQAPAASGKQQASKPLPTGASPASPSLPVDIKSLPPEQIVAGLRDPETRTKFLAGLGVKQKPAALDPFGRPA